MYKTALITFILIGMIFSTIGTVMAAKPSDCVFNPTPLVEIPCDGEAWVKNG